MANNKNNKNEGRVTAGDLFDRLRKRLPGEEDASVADASINDAADDAYLENGFSIDATSGGNSDSELDINELLRKYMPEYADPVKEAGEADLSAEADGNDADAESEDARFSSALDSAFALDDSAAFADFDYAEDNFGEDYAAAFDDEADKRSRKKPAKEKKRFSLFGSRKKKTAEIEEMEAEDVIPPVVEEPTFDAGEADGAYAPLEEQDLEMMEAPLLPKDDVSFHTTDLRLGDLAELETILTEPQPGNRITPETKAAAGTDGGDLLLRLAALEAMEQEAEAPTADPVAEPTTTEESGEEILVLSDLTDAEEMPLDDAAAEDGENFALDAEAQITEAASEEEIDPTDLNLRVAFGLDVDDKKVAATLAARELGDKLEERQYKRSKRAKLDRPEFVDKTQIPKIRKEYKNRMTLLWIKLALAAVCAIVLVWFENVSFFTGLLTGAPKQFAGAFDPAVYPVVYIMMSLQLMLLTCIFAYEQIIDGFKCILRGIPKAESVLSFVVTLGIIYSAVMARVIEAPNEPKMFNFVIALCAVLSLVYAIYNTKREIMNFDVVSSKKTKHIVRGLPDAEAQYESEAFEEQTDACDVMKIEKTDFIDGFFGRLHKPDSTVNVYITFLMSVAAALAVLAGFFVGLRGGGAADVLSTGFITLLISCPLSILVAFSYPFFRATVAAKEYESAIIGEASLAEYSNASIISFDDKNVFPSYSVKIQNIKIFNNARVDRVLYYAASVFAYAGGPLQDVFEVTTLDMGHSEDVQIFDTEAGFLATQVNGVNIIFGNYRTLTAKGFDIPVEYASDDVDFTSELSVMYMFREDKLVAKMYIKYVMDGDIDLILKQFQSTGLYVCVRTFDPNIDERMIAKKLNMRKIPLKVVRYASTDEVTMYEEKVDSGLVTSASPKSLLQVISYCDKVLHARKANIAMSILSVIIGIAIVGLMILADSMGIVNSLFVAVYHLLWSIPAIISAKVFIR